MPEIIRDGRIVTDDVTWWAGEGPLPAGKVLMSLESFTANEDTMAGKPAAEIGVQVQGDAELAPLLPVISKIGLIAIEFPKFTDGRGYSLARLIRERTGFSGELRAVGDVLRDQLFFMQRCGFNAFAVRADRSLQDAMNGLSDFSVTYQADANDIRPIYSR